ncbi:hypothetical protein FPRO05_02089 [Fusarium proliferatum]|uniref:Amidase domain-containing protein n=1 Tax=Gibberella intermedia TaxID=948311 RepID=A0A365N9B5_GIBIN|nr:hypothetical protein FPRO05_02089 [Fusarium proliferatum]
MGSRSSLVVDGVYYLVHPQSLLQIAEPTGLEPIPVVLLPIGDSISSVNDALRLINRFADIDDVYSPSFARAAVTRSSTERGFVEVLKKYIPLNLLSRNGLWKRIAVPSCLYSVRTPTTPLAGARMGIKDIFRLEGTQTTLMSRPWIELYGADEQSADYTNKLIKLGAVIVGKTKMTSFASPEEPTDQWVDFHCPVNPRGDGYQSPSSGSTGAATSLAGYDWLDFSIAGDSAGSVRAPAPCNGLFSLRPSFGSTSMNGIPVNSPYEYTVLQTQALTDEFVKILEDFLGVKRTPFSFVKEWEKNPPRGAGSLPLLKYTEKSAFWSLCYDYYHGFDSFRDEYSAKFGKKPFVSSVEYATYMKQLEVFRSWFTENVMGPDSKTLSNAILIMPYGEPHPEYRDEANPPAGTFPTVAEKFISPILHAPQLVLPFAQMPYLSKVSGRLEMRPIASTVIGAKGSDLMLIKLATEALKKAGWPTSIQTGRYMYPVADNARNAGSESGESLAAYEMRQKAVQELQREFEEKSSDFICNAM